MSDLCLEFRVALIVGIDPEPVRRALHDRIERYRSEGSTVDARLLIDTASTLNALGDGESAWTAMAAAAHLDSEAWEPRWIGARTGPRVWLSAGEAAVWYDRLTAGIDSLSNLPGPQTRAEADEALRGLSGSTNFLLAYHGHDELERQKAFGRLTGRVMASLFPELAGALNRLPRAQRVGDQRIRIGYASAFFSSHTILLLFNAWIRGLDRQLFKVHVYLVAGKRDSSSESVNRTVEIFRDLRGDLSEAIAAIRDDELDILVYPDVGMESRSFCLAALRLAPTQCASWGHPVTTGLPSIDFFLSSALMEPEDGDRHYSEALVRLPGSGLCYSPPAEIAAKSRSEFGLPDQATLYLCCQAVQKYKPEFDYVFPAIAREISDARFVFILNPKHFYANRLFRSRLEDAFRSAGQDPAPHLIFLPWSEWFDFLSLLGICDVFLDSIGWSGGNTALEALASGLPVITLPGHLMRGRHSYAFLTLLEIDEGIAENVDDFVRKATALGTDPVLRRAVSNRISANRGRLFEDRGAIQALQAFYERCVV